jgi:actin-related protein 8
VVDIGSDKINICCVDEGVILPGSYVRKNFGSRDIDLVLSRIIQRKHMYLLPLI